MFYNTYCEIIIHKPPFSVFLSHSSRQYHTHMTDIPSSEHFKDKPPAIIVLGMAGAGKTTLVKQLRAHLSSKDEAPYVVNLDPAVMNLPYTPNIDIRDSVDYKQLMVKHKWGPNGAIMAALNLFVTRYDKLEELLMARHEASSQFIFDTPGQIEVFTWSASGEIITRQLGMQFPTVCIYVVDSIRASTPVTFVSNMLYACSILYRMQVPMVVVLNKADAADADKIATWMHDYEELRAAFEVCDTGSYHETMSDSLALMLEEFYGSFKPVRTSAITGAGMAELVEAIQEASVQYISEFDEKMSAAVEAREKVEGLRLEKQMELIKADIGSSPKKEGDDETPEAGDKQ
eukprot:gnl/Dysnectes_brevis/1696_a1928_2435.p1 GENE.gnl/Dysnectes_brevis/1696_a1928_2435~~gnl/Dysnectes_brevis/1696_a1928_2435.p1  ORF type:complete len:346 (+),score=54.43 gnl/Dysnectes_brevis/1696_a1928_2435:26-1063(+)